LCEARFGLKQGATEFQYTTLNRLATFFGEVRSEGACRPAALAAKTCVK